MSTKREEPCQALHAALAKKERVLRVVVVPFDATAALAAQHMLRMPGGTTSVKYGNVQLCNRHLASSRLLRDTAT